jgi:uncharacterized protein GlcG (DUF336 family)
MAKITEEQLNVARTIVNRLSTLEAIYKETEQVLGEFRKSLEEEYGNINIDLSSGEYEVISEEENNEEQE